MMIVHYIKTAFRNFSRQKLCSFINITSLAIGMAGAIIILLWVQDELSYDKFHKNSQNLYRVEAQADSSDGINRYAITPAPLGPALKERYPDITNAARVYKMQSVVRYKKVQFKENYIMTDPSFLKMFTFPLIKGNKDSALSQPDSVVITQKTAEKYFGEQEPMGKVLNIQNKFDLMVTGVMKNTPQNSHLRFDLMVPFALAGKLGSSLESWHEFQYYTYVQLGINTSEKEVSEKIKDIFKKVDPDTSARPYLQKMTGIHLHSNAKYDIEGQGDIRYVYIFTFIALFVLLIACINFMNLSTARSSTRAKEIGVRKVVGAFRTNIMKQFLGESVFISFIALIIAVLLIQLFLPVFNNLSGKQLSLNDLGGLSMILGLLGVTLLTGIISGIYPAVLLSSFKTVRIFKGAMIKGKGGALFRRVLVVVQFSLSILLIIGAGIAHKQLHYIKKKNLGFQKEQVLYVPLVDQKGPQDFYSLKNKLKQNANILGVTASDRVLTYVGSKTSRNDWEGKDPNKEISIYRFIVDYDFVETLGMKLIEGRSFSSKYQTDEMRAFVVNQEVKKLMGVDKAAGKKFSFWGIDGKIIGVVQNFHFKPLHQNIEPMVMLVAPKYFRYAYIRLQPDNISSTLGFIKKTWKEFLPNSLFEYEFLDDNFNSMYRTEQRMGMILNSFSVFAILVACLGIFGLASFTTEKRSKEIGIRKILGASAANISVKLSVEFTKWVLLANLLAWPVAYFIMNRWLQNFAYRTQIGIWSFLTAALLSVLITLLTVSYQSIKAAVADPVDLIRYE